ncbi:MAG: hypothetical protein Q7R99_03425 [bacterium]|nr:hypothetical protein [bacterium]
MIQTKQVNITQAYEESISDIVQLKIVDIRNKVIELWDKQPIITQFPDMVAIIEPTQQLNCVVQGKKSIISNQDIAKEFEGRDLDNFIRFVISFSKTIGRPLKAFGFNYTFLLDFSDYKDKLSEIREKNKSFLNLSNLEIENKDFLGNGINISYMKDKDRIQIISMPNYDEALASVVSLVIQTNVHFYEDKIPEFADLIVIFRDYHRVLVEKLNQIYNI